MLWGTRVFSETLTTPQPLNWKVIMIGYKDALNSGTLVIYSIVVGLCSAIGYCFSAVGPQIAIDLFKLSPAEYGYWNLFNMTGMLAGGLLAKLLLLRFSGNNVVQLGLSGTVLGLSCLLLISCYQLTSVILFFSCTLSLYLFSGLLFAGGSFIASNSVADKASGAAMMSFINMVTATISVIVIGWISTNSLIGFVTVLAGLWSLVFVLLLVQTCFTKRIDRIQLEQREVTRIRRSRNTGVRM